MRLWDVRKALEISSLQGHTDTIRSTAISQNQRLLVTGSDDGLAKIWNLLSGELEMTLKGHTSSIKVVAFAPDSLTVATGSYDDTWKLWDAATGQCRFSCSDHKNTVWGVDFSPDGQLLVTASQDRTVRLWDWKQLLQLEAVLSTLKNSDGALVRAGRDTDWGLNSDKFYCGRTMKTGLKAHIPGSDGMCGKYTCLDEVYMYVSLQLFPQLFSQVPPMDLNVPLAWSLLVDTLARTQRTQGSLWTHAFLR